jgi:hypothetical protein
MKNIVTMFITLLLTISVTFAADNSIYIDQVGGSSTIDITQDGSANKIYGVGDSEGTAATLTGNSQTIDIRQIGSSNLLGIDLDTDVVSGVGIDLTYYITGSNSVASIDVNGDGLGTAANNTVDIRMTGDYNDLTFDLLGTGNSLTATATGGSYNDFNFTINADSTTSSIGISGGGGNTTTLNLSSDSATVDIAAVGASNTTSVTQSGLGGINGMNFDLSITGSSNSVTSSQTGSQDNDIDVNITGSGNTWSIIQSD